MNDEVRGKIMHEFVGLKSTMYSLVTIDGGEIKKAKGVNKNIVDSIRHKEYGDILFDKRLIRHNIKNTQSKLHIIGTYDIFKNSASVKFLMMM